MTFAMSTRMPLTGCRVLVTRARTQAGALTEQLQRLGATVVELPAIEIVPADPAPLDDAIRRLTSYDWIVFTSANAVRVFIDRLIAVHDNAAVSCGVKVTAIGHATAQTLLDAGVTVDLMPNRYIGESVVRDLESEGIGGQRILLPQAEIARDTVADGLRRAGAIVDVVVAYRTMLPDGHDPDEVRRLIADVDVVTFASPSSVRNVLTMAGGQISDAQIVCIGPVTADAAREAGLTVAGVADIHTTEGIIDTIVRLVERAQEEVPDGRHS